jgi:hypothetical protein
MSYEASLGLQQQELKVSPETISRYVGPALDQFTTDQKEITLGKNFRDDEFGRPLTSTCPQKDSLQSNSHGILVGTRKLYHTQVEKML